MPGQVPTKGAGISSDESRYFLIDQWKAAVAAGKQMKSVSVLLGAALLSTIGLSMAAAECQIADAKLEEAISTNPRLHGPVNRQAVRDLRSLRDAAFTLRSYGRHEDCERLLANIRELIAGPSMSTLGGNDEEDADLQDAAREPKTRRGAALGSRDEKGAKPLVAID